NASNTAYRSVGGALFDRGQTTLIAYPAGNAATSYALPAGVTSIGDYAFAACRSLASVTIPNSVASIGQSAFYGCSGLAGVTIPGSVTNLGDSAFHNCAGLASVTIAGGVTNLGDSAFYFCPSLISVYFEGNAPALGAYSYVFFGDEAATIYYLPGTTGWAGFAANTGLAPVLWNPQVQTTGGGFGVRTNQFGFTASGTAGLVVVVEASTSLAKPAWQPLGTNTLNGGSFHFSDPQWTNYPARFYRLRMP
ncbi:MAG TPA: leucine-rich repeat domain-containing protein, partial [Dongiaceae bacterium]|nr:leucine-rich repeat domain-containing protein [Dongiaceae bacterium]